MSDINDVISFEGSGLNHDDSIEVLGKGDSKYRLNVVIEDGKFKKLTRVKGNENISYALSEEGSNEAVGYVYDEENYAGIYFIKNSSSNHSIIRYNHIGGTFTRILWEETSLGFTTKIHNPSIIGDGDKSFLVWTDGVKPTRMLNITRAINYTAGVGTPTFSSLDSATLNLHKPAPVSKPSITLVDGVSDDNFIRGAVRQFAYRYVYQDGMKSVWSPFSLVDIQNTEFLDGSETRDVNASSLIRLGLNVSYASIERIELAYRKKDVLGVEGVWYIYDDISVSGVGALNYDYRGDKTVKNADQSEFLKNYESVPLISKALEVINSNSIVLADNKEGYDNPESPALSLTTEQESLSDMRVEFAGFNLSDISGGGFVFLTVVFDAAIEMVHEFYTSHSTSAYDGGTMVFNSTGYASQGDLVDAMVAALSLEYVGAPISFGKGGTVPNEYITITSGSGTVNVYYIRSEVAEKKRSVSYDSDHQIGIVYYDANGVDGGVAETGTYTPSVKADANELHGIAFDIDHEPPSWATQYQFVYGGSSNEDFFYLPVCIHDIYDDGAFIAKDVVSTGGGYTSIDFEKALSKVTEGNTDTGNSRGTKYRSFTPQVGDSVKIIGGFQRKGGFSPIDDDFPPLESTFFEDEIQGKFHITEVDSGVMKIDYSNPLLFQNELLLEDKVDVIMMKVMRPLLESDSDEIYYREIGERYDITGGYHTVGTNYGFTGATVRDQTVSLSAKGVVEFGDVVNVPKYWYVLSDSTDLNSMVFYASRIESRDISFNYDSLATDEGRLNVYNPDFGQVRRNTLRYGGTYLDDTNVNNLNSFDALNEKDLDDRMGYATVLKQVGFTLKILQERKLSSAYLGRQLGVDSSGASTLSYSNDVIGTIDPRREEYGTQFPFSVSKNDNSLYFFDIYSGAVLRDSGNQLFNISKAYRMGDYFREKSKALLLSGLSNVDVISGYDDVNEMYLLTFIDSVTPANNDTVAFHEPTNRWFSFFSFIPELYGNIGENEFMSFKDGQLWLHNSDNVDRGSFYGTDYDSVIEVVSNESAANVKSFDCVKQHSNKVWDADDVDAVTIVESELPNGNFRGMQSKFPNNKWRFEEGVYKSEFLRDSKTTSDTPSNYDLLNGRTLKGKAVTVRFKSSDADNVSMFLVEVGSTISP